MHRKYLVENTIQMKIMTNRKKKKWDLLKEIDKL